MPQKKITPTVKSTVTENDSMSIEEQKAAMQEQFKFQLKALMKGAAEMGIDLKDIYEQPPSQTTVVMDATQLIEAIKQAAVKPDLVKNPSLNDLGQPIADVNLKPGQLIPGTQNWRPWGKNDLDPEAMVEFVPLPIPSILFPFVDNEGRQKIRLDVNNLICWLTVGESCKVNKFFHNVYMNAYDQWRELENFKRNGPIGAPWGSGEGGNPAWKYTPFAPSFGMTDEGRSIRVGPPTALDYIAGVESPTGPAGSEEGS